ncbi:MAG: T9SS type A sorting domain-containing protein [Bacteroidales bacterium]|nr:T9SS type A sorting domain-containing protein [Bacteroidales bacterium]
MKIKSIILLASIILSGFYLKAQTTVGPNFPATGVNLTGVGTVAWTNPTRVTADDNSYSSAAVNNSTSNYLKATGYGFAIPSGATINGITVTIGRYGTTGSGADVRDNVVKLVKGGTIVGNNLAVTGTDWTNSETAVNYGSTSNLWGTTWTSSDINASDFGVVLAVNSTNSRTANVDYIRVSITYTVTNVAPTISSQPTDQTVCNNAEAIFTAESTDSNPTPTATWQISTGGSFSNLTIASPYSVNTSTASGTTTSSLTINPATNALNSYQYRVIFSNSAGSAISNPGTLNVNPTSVGGSVTGGSSPVCLGSGTGTMTLSGHTGSINKWQKKLDSGSWADISNTSTTYSETPTSAGSWQYRAEVQSGVCAATFSNPVTIVVNPRPTSVISGTETVCYGQTANLSITLTGTGPWNLVYTDGSTPVTVNGINASPYTFAVNTLSTKTYTVTSLSDSKCTANAGDMTGSATVTVNAGCQVVTLSQPDPLTATITGSANINCGSSTNLTVTISGGTAPYQVTYNGNNYNGPSPIIFSVSPTETITFNSSNVALSDAHGCDAVISGSATVSVIPVSAPVATDATNITVSGFTANWDAVPGVNGYFLDVSENIDFSTFVNGFDNLNVSNVTTYPVTGLNAGQTYHYRLRAYTTACTSVSSNIKTVSTTGLTIGAPVVSGAPFTVDCTTPDNGTITFTHGTFNAGNIFTAQLSDNTGSFTTPVSIGTANNSETSITITIPANTASGNNSYKIRVVSSDPVVMGDVSNTFTIIKDPCQAIYRSVQSGAWNLASTWEVSTDAGNLWEAAVTNPVSTDGSVSIRNGHTVTVTNDVTVDEVIVEAGATLRNELCPDGFLNINDGPGTDLIVNGTMISEDDINNEGSISFASGSLYQHVRSFGKKSPATFSEIPVANWDAQSTCEILSVYATPYAGLNQAFGNFNWNFATQNSAINLNGTLSTINGDLIITSTGTSELQLASSQTTTLSVGGDVQIEGGKLNLGSGSGVTTLSVAGNTEVSTGATLITRNSKITGNGNFVLNSGANLWIGSVSGITSAGINGNIQVNGSRSYSTGANYTYTGSSNQVTGDGLPGSISNFGVSTTSGAILTLTSTSQTCENLTIANNAKLQIDADKQLTVNTALVNNAGVNGLVIKSSSTSTGSLMHNSNNVPAKFERMIANDLKWHFLASPIVNQSIWPEFAPTPAGSPLSFGAQPWEWDFYYWNTNSSITSQLYWVNLRKPNGEFNTEPLDITGSSAGYGSTTPASMESMRGYLVAYNTNWNAATGSPETHVFNGNLHNGSVSRAIIQGANNFNLIGNPYPSAIDWKASSGWNRDALKANATSSGYDYWIWNDAVANYGAFNSADADGSGSNGVDRYIAPTQAFFVQAADNGNLVMDNQVRTHSTQDFLKSGSFNPGFIKLKLSSSLDNHSDEMVVSFDPAYTVGGTDKWWSFYAESPEIYAVKDGNYYSISRYNEINDDLTVDISTKIGLQGSYMITAPGISDFTLSSKVLLEDLKTGTITNLKQNPVYSFIASPDDNRNRFRLLVGSPIGMEENHQEQINIYSSANTIYILNEKATSVYQVQIVNMIGQSLYSTKLSGTGIQKLDSNLSPGVYIVSVLSEGRCFSKKVVIR